MKTITEKVITLLLALFMISYGLYQGFRFVDKPFVTEIAYDYTVADSYVGKGFFIREEQPFALESDGVVHYCYENGTKVTEGTLIAECFENDDYAKKQNVMNDLEKEINDLKQIETNTSVNYSGTEIVSKQISTIVASINESVYSARLNSISDYRSQITKLVNKRNIISGKTNNFDERIVQLDSKLADLKGSQETDKTDIYTELNGYFVDSCDGYESDLNAADMSNINLQFANGILNSYESSHENESKDYAKIVKSHNWYFAIVVSNSEKRKFENNNQIEVDFPTLNISNIPAKVYNIIQNEENPEEDCVVLLKSNYVIKELLEQRVTEVNVRFQTYSGLKINSNAIRFLNNEIGVYVIDDQQVEFKPIEITYDGNGYVLANTKSKLTNTVCVFDEVIVEGTELTDGKTIK